MNPHHRRRVVASVILLAAAATPARAQTSPSASLPNKRDSIPLTSVLQVDASAFGGLAIVIDSAEIASSHARQLSEFLTARAPGVSVLRSGGVEAEGARVALRGPRSLSFPTYPLLIVDGMRVDATQEAATIDFDVHPSRLDDIPLADISQIVILPGAVSASFFGPGAVNGVIAITTNRARGERWDWRSAIETRVTSVPDHFPPNYRQTGLTPAGTPAFSCDRITVSQGNCIPNGLTQWNPLEQASPFHLGRALHAQGEASGATRLVSAFAGVTADRDLGVTNDDDAGKLTGRVNVDEQPLNTLRFSEHAGYQRTSAGFPARGNFTDRSNVIANGLLGTATDDSVHGYWGFPNMSTSVGRQRATHWQLGMNGGWRARSWLDLLGSVGYDKVAQRDHASLYFPPPFDLRRLINGTFNHHLHTAEVAARATYAIHSDVGATSTIGFTRWTSATDAQYASPNTIVTQPSILWRATGPFVSQRMTWRDRVSLGASARSEQMTESFFGALPRQLLKTLDASWTLPPVIASTEFRLRAAYGEGSQAPRSDPEIVARVVSGLLRPVTSSDSVERTIEREVGADLRFGKRAAFAITLYSDNSGNLAFNPPIAPPPPGAPFYSYGSMRTSGVNASGTFVMIDRGALRWDLAAGLSTIRNRVISLGSAPPFIYLGNRIQSGFPLSNYFAIPYSYADANHNGLIEPAEVQASATQEYVGSALPTREAFLRNELALTRNLTMRATIDYRGGQYLWNRNEDARCGGSLNCRGAEDPAAPLAEQAAFIAQRLDFTHHIEKAGFTKLRELSLAWRVPAPKYTAGRDVTLSIAGMNLWTWTKYKGVDPEVTTGWFDDDVRMDLSKSPIPRTLILRLDFH